MKIYFSPSIYTICIVPVLFSSFSQLILVLRTMQGQFKAHCWILVIYPYLESGNGSVRITHLKVHQFPYGLSLNMYCYLLDYVSEAQFIP